MPIARSPAAPSLWGSTPVTSAWRHMGLCGLPLLTLGLLAFGVWHGGVWLLAPLVWLHVVAPAVDVLTGWEDRAAFGRPAGGAEAAVPRGAGVRSAGTLARVGAAG